MARPLRKPLQAYLEAEGLTMVELRQILQDGAEEAERIIPKLLEKGTVGGQVRAGQTSLVLREIRVLMSSLFGDVGRTIQDGRLNAAETAARGEDILLEYLRQNGLAGDADKLLESFVVQARQGFANIRAKALNAIPLSSQVYRTQALATNAVNRLVSRGILLGQGSKQIAASVRDLIRPDVKGGVSYAAMRLARTELTNAFRTAQEERYKDEPWTRGMRWNLSGSHPAPDICNKLAAEDRHDLGEGIYPIGQRPNSHPNCLCYLTPEQIDEEEFVDRFVNGEYDEYLDDIGDGPVIRDRLAEVVPITEAKSSKVKKESPFPAGAPDDAFQNPVVRASLTSSTAFRASHRGNVNQDTVMEAIASTNGFSDVPTLASPEEVENAVRDGRKPLLMRAMQEAGHTRNLRFGDYYAGVGNQGNGIYFHYRPYDFDAKMEVRREEFGDDAELSDEDLIAKHGQEDFDYFLRRLRRRLPTVEGRMLKETKEYGEFVVRGTLRPDTIIQDMEKDVAPAQAAYLRELQDRLSSTTDQEEKRMLDLWITAMQDAGRYAAAAGIQAYYGTTPGEIIVVDRSALLIEREDV